MGEHELSHNCGDATLRETSEQTSVKPQEDEFPTVTKRGFVGSKLSRELGIEAIRWKTYNQMSSMVMDVYGRYIELVGWCLKSKRHVQGGATKQTVG